MFLIVDLFTLRFVTLEFISLHCLIVDLLTPTVFLFKNCPGQRNRELPWAMFALKLALAIFALGFFEFSSGLETLTDRSGSKNALECDRNQLRRLILRPVHGTFTFSPNSAKIADPQKLKNYPGQFLHKFQKSNF